MISKLVKTSILQLLARRPRNEDVRSAIALDLSAVHNPKGRKAVDFSVDELHVRVSVGGEVEAFVKF